MTISGRRSAVGAAVCAATTALLLTGCSPSAAASATDDLTSNVEAFTTDLESAAGNASSARELIGKTSVQDYSGYRDDPDALRITGSGWYEAEDADGTATIALLAIGRGESRSWFATDQAIVARCVEFRVVLGAGAESGVTQRRIACPAGLRSAAGIGVRMPEV